MTPRETLHYWCQERERIRKNKEAGKRLPWTEDWVLQKFRFCNVRREDDRVTRWIKDHIREPYARHQDLWFMLVIARQLNWPDTLQEIMDEGCWPGDPGFSPEALGKLLDARKNRKEKVYTGAYMIRAESDRGKPWYEWSKQRYMAEIVLGKVWENREWFREWFRDPARTVKRTHEQLSDYHGWGPFMAYQVCVDMIFTDLLGKAPDRDTWAAAGPGTLRGLNRLLGRDPGAPLHQANALIEIRALWDVINRIEKDEWPRMDFTDVPNILCEFDKYIRTVYLEGRPRSRYVPGRGS